MRWLTGLLAMGVDAFARKASGYDVEVASVLSAFSSAAYCPPFEVKTWQFGDRCAVLSSFNISQDFLIHSRVFGNENSGFGYIGIDLKRKWVLAAFKGSNNTIDWIHDFQGLTFDFEPCSLQHGTLEGNVHSGFCAYYQPLSKLGIASKFVALLESHPSFTPVITGHSLGATAAVLMAYDVSLASKGAARPLVYTFGLPRIADFAFSEALSQRVSAAFRVVHGRDLVPHLPPCVGVTECWTYDSLPYHIATEIWYPKGTGATADYTVCDGSGEDQSCSDGQLNYSFEEHCEYFGKKCGGTICGGCCLWNAQA